MTTRTLPGVANFPPVVDCVAIRYKQSLEWRQFGQLQVQQYDGGTARIREWHAAEKVDLGGRCGAELSSVWHCSVRVRAGQTLSIPRPPRPRICIPPGVLTGG